MRRRPGKMPTENEYINPTGIHGEEYAVEPNPTPQVKPLTEAEERRYRLFRGYVGGIHLDRIWSTLDAARRERDERVRAAEIEANQSRWDADTIRADHQRLAEVNNKLERENDELRERLEVAAT
jgi:hypothetical protein